MKTSTPAAMERSLILILAVTALCAISVLGRARADEPKVLFKTVSPGTLDLNDKQGKLLDRLKNAPTTLNVQIVKLQDSVLADAPQPLSLALSADRSVELRDYKVAKFDGAQTLTWSAPETRNAASVAVRPNAATGLIWNDGKVYSVEPLGGGLQAMVQLDQSKFHMDHPESFEKIEKVAKKIQLPPMADQPAAPVIEITVLVAYTPKVDSEVINIQSLIDGAVTLANNSYVNSKVNIKLKLVQTVKVNYVESGSHDTDLERFRTKGDNIMEDVHALRDQHKADVCVLLIDNDQYCGLAADILAKADTAFCVVHFDCAVKNISFAHEIGHLQGARHNLEVDPTIDPTYPWNHGYLYPGGGWRTIMAYPTAANPNRIPYWSNPNVSYNGAPTGVANKMDNARMLNFSASMIAAFR
jgi:hypothetical protein